MLSLTAKNLIAAFPAKQVIIVDQRGCDVGFAETPSFF